MTARSLLLVILAVTGVAAAQTRAPYRPASDAEILQRVPPASDAAVREIATRKARLARDPANARAADELAKAYIDFGRRVGDARYAGYAEAVIAPWVATAAPPAPILVTQATILQYRHYFDQARALLDQAVARDPRLPQAWLTLAALDLVQGDYANASVRCAQAAKHGGIAVGLACNANVRANTGGAAQAVALLARIDTEAADVPASYRAWIYGLRAEAAERLGNDADAEANYRRALAMLPGDNFLLCAYADFLLDRGRAKEVVPLLVDYADSDTAYLRLAIAHAALRSPDAGRYQWTMAARFEAYRQRGDDSFGREEARFLLHVARDPDAALAVALRNWQKQKEVADTRLVLEAAQAARKPHAAATAIAFIASAKLADPRIDAMVRALAQNEAAR